MVAVWSNSTRAGICISIMTSHSSQGQTADRVLIHVDTELGAKDLLNSRMAYVSVSRGRYDAQIYRWEGYDGLLGKELSVKRRLLYPVASRKHTR
jgi:ATP-dependent exoDNAse (exonuclease V) alpha subunit